jgi:hypothetical protein
MKHSALAFAALAVLPLAAAADVSKEDLRKLVAAGLSDEVITAYVRANAPVAKLTPDDLADLKQAGASDKVLTLAASNPAPAAAAAPPAPRVVERVVEPPVVRTTYVDAPVYSSSYYSTGFGYGYGYGYPYYGYPYYGGLGYGYGSCYPGYTYPRTVVVGGSCGPRLGPSVGVGIRIRR